MELRYSDADEAFRAEIRAWLEEHLPPGWFEPGFEPLDAPGFVAALADALLAHRDFADLETVNLPRAGKLRLLWTALRGALDAQGRPARAAARRGRNGAPVGRCAKGSRPARARAQIAKEAPHG